MGCAQGPWPKISAEFLAHVLKNTESNMALMGLDRDSLVIEHIQMNKAPEIPSRTSELMGCLTHM